MPLKAPAEKAILGANQFKFQLSPDRKARAALTSLAVHEIAGLIIGCFNPLHSSPSLHTHTHAHTHSLVFVSPLRGSSHFHFPLKAIECNNGCLYCKSAAFLPRASVHVYPFHMFTNICTLIHTAHYNMHRYTHAHGALRLPAGFASLMGRNTSFNQTGQLRTNFSFVLSAWGPRGLQSLYCQSAAPWLFVQKLTLGFLIRTLTLIPQGP